MIITTIGDEIGENLKEQIKILKQVKMNYIEMRKVSNKYLWEFSKDELEQIKKELKMNEINVITIDTPIGKKDNSFNYKQNNRLLKEYIKIANIFEATYLRIFSDTGREKNINSIREVLMEMEDIASKNKIKLLIENEKETWAESINQCNNLIDKLENVYILFDIENAYSKGYDILSEYEKNKEKIKYIHLRDYNKENKRYSYIGKGTIPILDLFNELKKDKYDGTISLETMLPKYNKLETRKEIFLKSYRSFMKSFMEG